MRRVKGGLCLSCLVGMREAPSSEHVPVIEIWHSRQCGHLKIVSSLDELLSTDFPCAYLESEAKMK